MSKIIPLTKIGFFNPGRLSDEEIEQSFIARIPFFEFVFKKISAEKPNSIPQQHLIIGQRGMGKSYLLNRIAAELRKSPYKDAFIPLSFPEEQYNVDRLSKFWLNCLDALADALDKENQQTDLVALDAEISSLSKEKEVKANQVYAAFEKWIAKIKRRPVLLVDNLNLIFAKIDKEEQHQLRAILMNRNAPILVGASATAIDETVDYQAPFYDAFQINYLKKLSFEESIEVLLNLAAITGNEEFKNTIYLERGRLKALYQLTGGTPRTLAILFPLIQGGFSENIQTDLDALLDVITPLYKARFEELSAQLQVVLDAVALHWDPINLEQLREVTMLENAQLSPQLKRLVDVGWLQKLEAYKAKGGAYELSERFFNVWYLMRRSSRRQKRELYCLTKFLESFYGNDLHEIARGRINCKSENLNHIALDLALADAVKEKILSDKLRNKSYEALIDISFNNDGILKNFSVPLDFTKKKIKDFLDHANKDFFEKKYLNAETSLLKLLKIDDSISGAWSMLGFLYHLHLDRACDAEMAYKKAIKINGSDFMVWFSLGDLYQNYLAKYKEAESSYLKALKLNPQDSDSWHNLGKIYSEYLCDYNKAEQAYKEAIKVDKNDKYSWNGLGDVYQRYLGKFKDAEIAYKNAIAIDGKFKISWNGLGNLYKNHLDNYASSEEAYLKSISLDNTSAFSWYGLGVLYAEKLGKYIDSEAAFKKAIKLDDKFAYPWHGLGNLYSVNLKQYEESEKAYKKAIELDDKFAYPWNGLGNLYNIHNDRYQEAEIAYKMATQIDERFSAPWQGLGVLYKNRFGKYNEAEIAFKKAIKLDDEFVNAWNSLGNLYVDHLGKYMESEDAYKNALKINEFDIVSLNGLANLYSDYMGKYSEAETLYLRALEKSPNDYLTKYNLLFLWRDKMDKFKEAKELFTSLKETNELLDSYLLNKALFSYYEKNLGIAESTLKEALLFVGPVLPSNTIDDWYRSAAVIVKLGFGDSLLSVLSITGHNIIFRPLYVAIEALTKNEGDLFLNSIAVEIREPAKRIVEIMKNYMK